MHFSQTILVSIFSIACTAHLCGHHAITAQPFSDSPDSTPPAIYEAHHIITETIIETASLSLHEDLKRQVMTSTASTHTPLFTGHGPVQPGVSFNPQSATTLSGVVPKGASGSTSHGTSSSKTQTGTASASAPTHSNAASLLAVSSWVVGLWSGVQLLGMVE